MNKKRCFIAGAGEFGGRVMPEPDDIIIAADGGCTELLRRGIMPKLVVGDFDSLDAAPEDVEVLRHPAEKNDTDMLLAVREAFTEGCGIFILDGGLGGRLDHTLANIQILTYIAQNGALGVLIGREYCVTAVADGTLRFRAGATGYVSVFCAGDKAEGVTLEGLKYPLDGAALTCVYPLGVSNEFTDKPASITVQKGTLIVVWADAPGFLEGL